MTDLWVALAADVLGITVLAYATYFRRYWRRDLLLAYVALNLGVFAVTLALVVSPAGVGLGLGLFGVLSILRLRSDAITQEEVAYYFVSLVLGLVAGVRPGPVWLPPVLIGVLVLVMVVVDHPRVGARSQRQTVVLDRAYSEPAQLRGALERLLGGEVKHLVVLELDLVRDTTTVDVRFRPGRRRTEAVGPARVAEPQPVRPQP